MSADPVSHVGPWLKKRRLELNLSLNDVMRESGVSKGILSKIERGSDFQLSTLKRLHATLRIRTHLIQDNIGGPINL